MEYFVIVFSYVTAWLDLLSIDLGIVTIPSFFHFIIIIWLLSNAFVLIRDYLFD